MRMIIKKPINLKSEDIKTQMETIPPGEEVDMLFESYDSTLSPEEKQMKTDAQKRLEKENATRKRRLEEYSANQGQVGGSGLDLEVAEPVPMGNVLDEDAEDAADSVGVKRILKLLQKKGMPSPGGRGGQIA